MVLPISGQQALKAASHTSRTPGRPRKEGGAGAGTLGSCFCQMCDHEQKTLLFKGSVSHMVTIKTLPFEKIKCARVRSCSSRRRQAM